MKELSQDQRAFVWRILDAGRIQSLPENSYLFEQLKTAIEKVVAEYYVHFQYEPEHPNYILMRGTGRYRAFDSFHDSYLGSIIFERQPGGDLIVRHRKVTKYRVLSPDDITHSQMMMAEECCEELFTKDHRCPKCGAQVYYSSNYMQLPEWLYHQEFRAKHGERALANMEMGSR